MINSKKNILKLTFITSLIVNLVLGSGLGYFVYKKGGISYLKQKFSRNHTKTYGDYYQSKVGLFKELPNQTNDIYLVGDSLTDFGEWQELLSNVNVKNRGVNGDTTSGIINRIQEITEGNPSKIFIMCGINNIQGKIPGNQTIEEYHTIIRSFLQKAEGSKIYLQSVLPINKKKYNEKIIPRYPRIHIPTNIEVNNINQFLMKTAEKYPNIQYVNLFQLTNSAGELIAEYTDDGLHLNGKGLIVWAEIINPFINE